MSGNFVVVVVVVFVFFQGQGIVRKFCAVSGKTEILKILKMFRKCQGVNQFSLIDSNCVGSILATCRQKNTSSDQKSKMTTILKV